MQGYKERKDNVCMRVYRIPSDKVSHFASFQPISHTWEKPEHSLPQAQELDPQLASSLLMPNPSQQADAVTPPDAGFLPQALLQASASFALYICVHLTQEMAQSMDHPSEEVLMVTCSHSCRHFTLWPTAAVVLVLCTRFLLLFLLLFLKFQ